MSIKYTLLYTLALLSLNWLKIKNKKLQNKYFNVNNIYQSTHAYLFMLTHASWHQSCTGGCQVVATKDEYTTVLPFWKGAEREAVIIFQYREDALTVLTLYLSEAISDWGFLAIAFFNISAHTVAPYFCG